MLGHKQVRAIEVGLLSTIKVSLTLLARLSCHWPDACMCKSFTFRCKQEGLVLESITLCSSNYATQPLAI